MESLKALSAVRISGLVLLLTCTLSSTAQDEPIPPPEPNPDPNEFLRTVNLKLDQDPEFGGDVYYEVKNLCGDNALPVEVEPEEKPLCLQAPVAPCVNLNSLAFLNSQVLTAEVVNFNPGQPDLLFRITVEPSEDKDPEALISEIKFLVRCLDIFSGDIVEVDATRVAESAHRKVFVTSETYTGDLGGIEGADAKCNALAQEAGLFGTYKAWISHIYGRRDDFTRSTLPYLRVDGVTVANNWSDLVDCGNPECLRAPINIDENGSSPSLPLFAWSFLDSVGGEVYRAADRGIRLGRSFGYYLACQNWTSSDRTYTTAYPGTVQHPLYGFLGELTRRDEAWTYSPETRQNCDQRAHLYCFQQ